MKATSITFITVIIMTQTEIHLQTVHVRLYVSDFSFRRLRVFNFRVWVKFSNLVVSQTRRDLSEDILMQKAYDTRKTSSTRHMERSWSSWEDVNDHSPSIHVCFSNWLISSGNKASFINIIRRKPLIETRSASGSSEKGLRRWGYPVLEEPYHRKSDKICERRFLSWSLRRGSWRQRGELSTFVSCSSFCAALFWRHIRQ